MPSTLRWRRSRRGSWLSKQPPAIRGTGYSVDALEAALWAVGGAADFRDAVLRAANLGDDADTTAAIAGQLAGARWGLSGIPVEWRERIVSADRIAAIAGRLYDAGVAELAPRWQHDEFLHAWWVEPGAVLAGEFPGHLDDVRAAEKVNLLVDYGVRTFVDLTTPADQLEPYEHQVTTAASDRGLDVRRSRTRSPISMSSTTTATTASSPRSVRRNIEVASTSTAGVASGEPRR